MKVFIIDDDPSIAEMLQEFTQIMGMDATVYHQASHFFADNHNLQNSLLLLDLQMPEMDGIEVMRQLVQRQLLPNIILMSGYDSSVLHSAEQLAQEHELNVIATLTKPIKFATLQSNIKKYIEESQQNLSTKQSTDIILTADDIEDAILEQQFVL